MEIKRNHLILCFMQQIYYVSWIIPLTSWFICIYHKLCVSENSGRKFAKYFYKSSPHSIPSFWLALIEKMECRTISHVCFWYGKAVKKLYNHNKYYTRLPRVLYFYSSLFLQFSLANWACCRSCQKITVNWEGLEDGLFLP